MIKGKEREVSTGTSTKYVGFTSVEVKAVNPTRSQLNKLLGREDDPADKELTYLSEDQEGNDRLRLTFWLYDEVLNKHFAHSFNITNKVRMNKDGTKTQHVNNTCSTSWSDVEGNLQNWFTNFTDKDKNITGSKETRPALVGEEELISLLRTWLGRMSWNDPDCSVLLDNTLLFKEDYSELRSLIDGDFVAPFVALLGVRTDESDPEKQYQQVYGKSFLPNGFMNYINNGLKFPTDYIRKIWDKFVTEVEGEYGFNAYFELVPCTEYDSKKDVATMATATEGVTPTSKF